MMTSTASAADFSCSICFETAAEPVVTRCGHLFCWECLEHWLRSPRGAPECPVCKGRVDERVAGDIIPLYGRGRQTSNKGAAHEGASSQLPPTATAASHTATETTASVDPAQEAFFSRPSAYSFVPARDSRHTSAATTGREQQQQQQQQHPRPNANRAPPPPRPVQQPGQYPHQNMQLPHGGMPLTMGSGIFFFGGGTGMFFSILVITVWTLYHYAPWREWTRIAVARYNRLRGQRESEQSHPHGEEGAAHRPDRSEPPAAAVHATATTSRTTSPLATDADADLQNFQQTAVHRLLGGFLIVFILIQLLVWM